MPLTSAEYNKRHREKHPESVRLSNQKQNAKFRFAGSTYVSWASMKQRCNNPNYIRWENYGGRGITYDPRWEKFANFHADMGDRPSGKTLDRIDNDGPYSKDNCKWSTPSEQNINRDFRRNAA